MGHSPRRIGDNPQKPRKPLCSYVSKRGLVRKAFALIATTGLVLAVLTGCSSGSGAADCNSPVTDGAASKLVTVSGAFDKSPKVNFPTPLKTKTTERSQIIAGTGDGLVAGQKVKLDLSFYNGTPGKVIEKSKYDGDRQADRAQRQDHRGRFPRA